MSNQYIMVSFESPFAYTVMDLKLRLKSSEL